MSNKNILDDIFGAEEEDVSSFADAILGTKVDKDSELGEQAHAFNKETPDQIQGPTLTFSRNGHIEIAHGWHGEDYVWHIKPWNPKKQYRVTLKRVLFAIAKTMSEKIPDHVVVDVFMPDYQWDIPEITFKAKGILNEWSIKNEDFPELNEKIFEVLNGLV